MYKAKEFSEQNREQLRVRQSAVYDSHTVISWLTQSQYELWPRDFRTVAATRRVVCLSVVRADDAEEKVTCVTPSSPNRKIDPIVYICRLDLGQTDQEWGFAHVEPTL